MNFHLHRKLKARFRTSLGTAGRFLPLFLKKGLARRSPKWSYLLLNDPPWILEDYLGDLRIQVSATNEIERVLISGRYEPELIRTIHQWVKPGDHALDIGANVGAITLALAKQVGPSGCVSAFEPGPPFFDRLRANVALNPALQKVVRLNRVGLSDEKGELLWGEDQVFPGNARLGQGGTTPVPVTTLDQFFATPPPRLDFMKIDVEGMELRVLRGAQKTIAQFKPLIVFETFLPYEQLESESLSLQTISWLEKLGYAMYHADGSVPPRPARYPKLSLNTLAIPPHHPIRN